MWKLRLTLILTAALLLSPASSCDDATWIVVEQKYDACVQEKSQELDRLRDELNGRISLQSCRIMDQLLECTAILTECMVSHFEQSEQKMFSLPIDPSASNNVQECQELLLKEQEDRHSISKRSPGKSSSGGSSGSKVSQVKTAVSSIIGSRSGTHGGVSRGAGAALAGKTGGNHKLLKKVGKYAVVGLAAYGTYKLAKSMAKGIRDLYDDDDCWEYNILQDRYNCVCNQQCNIYVNGASFNGLTSSLLVFSTALSLYINYFRNSNW